MRLMHYPWLVRSLVAPHVLQAQELKDGTPGVITGGSGNVSVGGLPAARNGDGTDSGDVVAGGSNNVFINGKPAVTTGDKSGCGGVASAAAAACSSTASRWHAPATRPPVARANSRRFLV